MTDTSAHSCSILNVTLAEDGIVCPHGFAIREGQEFQLGGQAVTLGPAEPVDAPAASPTRNVAVSVYKALERYGCIGSRPETIRLADALLADFVIIHKHDLPEVRHKSGILTAWAPGISESKAAAVDTENLRLRAYALLAIAEHADANPPVDEDQVSALTSIIDELGSGWAGMTEADLARRLIATGRVEVQA